jgi:hypothetical protein
MRLRADAVCAMRLRNRAVSLEAGGCSLRFAGCQARSSNVPPGNRIIRTFILSEQAAGMNAINSAAVIARVRTFAFSGIEAIPVEVQVQISPGVPALLIVGLPD